ncbi:TLC domain-containing protein [Lasiosphaeria miniovina]|uniref:TLC domain-containing protein n=1 Tax=Lasiosphaeria miniovina TaxID=1954250 RepID=A0AA40AV44_9PEZI|nr:TLC domain-containing protein [Lasiosphaeria miniovina]KAK0722565.1 TLC domain-containing protein [Lasiosphaeria miniovina]
MASESEPFPALATGASDRQLPSDDAGAARRRRKSSALGEMRFGDTGGPALSTSTGLAHLHGTKESKDAGAPPSKRFTKRRKARSALRRIKNFAFKHTWLLPLVIMVVVLSLYALNPTESNPLHRFIFLSYEIPSSSSNGGLTQYGKGRWDFAFVAFYTVVLSFTRELVMQEMLRPLARYYGLRSRGKQARFMEQMYTAVYFGVLGPAGMYVMSRTPVWYFNTYGMYENFPHKTHEAVFKTYYLIQAAYWAQQAIVLLLGVEKPRKDFKEFVGHHVVTLSLIYLSYRFHFTYIGLAVYITHDISDFFLASSKSLNYVDSSIMAPFYAFFVFVWIYMRHYLNLRIIFSLFTEFKTVGPYEINWETQQYKSPLAFWVTLGLLGSLQALNLFWLFFIVRIGYRFAVTNVAKDDRSDAEDSEVEDEPVDTKTKTYATAAALDGKAAAQLEDEHNSALERKHQAANGHAGAAAVNGKAKVSASAKSVSKKASR